MDTADVGAVSTGQVSSSAGRRVLSNGDLCGQLRPRYSGESEVSDFLVIGIDPGLHGAIAVLNDLGQIISLQDTPTILTKRGGKNKNVYLPTQMATILEAIQATGRVVVVGIERAQAMPGQGVTSMFSIGYGYGIWLGILAALRLPVEIVESKAWKKAAQIPSGSDKAASVVRALQLWPSCTQLARKRDDGRADALLVCNFVRVNCIPKS